MSNRPPGMPSNYPLTSRYTDPTGEVWKYNTSLSKWQRQDDRPGGNENDRGGRSPDPTPVIVTGPTRFNPPLISLASGSWRGSEADLPRDRGRIVGPASESLRVRQRGVLLPDLTFASDWRTTDPLPSTEDGDKSDNDNRVIYNSTSADLPGDSDIDRGTEYSFGSLVDRAMAAAGLGGSDKEPTKEQSLIANGRTYGFRFHYNPSQISINAQMVDGINPSVVMSQRDSTVPMGFTSTGSVGITLYLNRIEDMSFIDRRNGKYVLKAPQGLRNGLYEGRPLNQEEMEGIVSRGTEYDLEFLFRTIMGRPFPTNLRGMTADLGLIWGTPTQLWLSRRMRYRGRVTSINWSHRSFNRFMVPLWTEVGLTFTRYPDVAAWEDAKSPNDGYQYAKAMGYNLPAVSPRSSRR